MKIRPDFLCGGAGTRLWHQSTNNPAKQARHDVLPFVSGLRPVAHILQLD